ncbi:MAG: ribonuclease HII [Pseudomonadota bacterium]
MIGVDEAGRGPLAGPVCAAAVVLPPDLELPLLNDSKKLTAAVRERLAEDIRSCASAWALGWASAREIDALNILTATHLAMARAIEALVLAGPGSERGGRASLPQPAQTTVWVDGNRSPRTLGPCQRVASVVKGDARVAEISAASILAKTARDRWMLDLHQQHEQYGFAEHKGYPTARHLALLETFGPCSEHRRSFAPVARVIGLRRPGTASRTMSGTRTMSGARSDGPEKLPR